MKNLKYLFLSVIIILFVIYFNIIEGDPSIYLSFSKSFFEVPFSFGSTDRVTFGATSPFFLLLITIFHKIFGVDSFLIPFKLFNLTLFASGIYLLKESFKKSIEFNKEYLFESILIFFLINFYFIENGIVLYESFLVVFYYSLLIYSHFHKKATLFVSLSAVGYLIRPEFILINFLSLNYITKNKQLLIPAFISFLIPIGYHLYMYKYTASLIPSSIHSRSVRFSDVFFIHSFLKIIKENPNIIIQILAIFFSFKFIKNNNRLYYFSLFSGLMGISILFFSKSFSVRYFEVFAILSLPISLKFIDTLVNSKFRNLIITFIIICVIYKFNFLTYSLDSTLNNRLANSFAIKLNEIIPKNEKILIYEIQTQYYLNSKVISLDSRVGSECIDLLKGEKNLIQIMNENDIKYISIDDNLSSLLLKDNYINSLYNKKNQLKKGDSLLIGSEVFIKIFDGNESNEVYKMYGDIFQHLK